MNYTKNLLLTILILLISFTGLNSVDNNQHCGKHFPKSEQETLKESISGIVQISDNQLKLIQDSTKTTYNLIIPENMEKEIEKIEVGKRYIFSGTNNKNGFVVDKFTILESPQTKGKTRVNSEKCIGCRLCVNQCPEGAISMVNGKAVIDQEKCIDCGICIDGNGHYRGCPVKAIEKE